MHPSCVQYFSSFIMRYSPRNGGRNKNNELLIVVGGGYCSDIFNKGQEHAMLFPFLKFVKHRNVNNTHTVVGK